LVKNYTNETGQSHVILRPSVVYGEREQSDQMIGDYFKRAIANTTLYVKGKDQILDFTYAKDLADGIALASTTENVSGIYNISRGKKEKVVDVANLIVKLVGKGKVKTIAKKKNIINCGTLDCSKAEDEFKFKPKTNIEKGLDLYYNWLKKTKRTWPE
jgi:nucleoside-diphosphate-sugar epimerase